MSKNKSFFQKLSDSFTSLFPFNSTARDIPNLSHNQFENNFSSIRLPLNRRLASEAFGKDDDTDIKIKRARLHHDPLSLPISRIIKLPNNQAEKCMTFNNNFNDAASDFSDTSNVSVSTSGVSSLHPRSNKRINFSHTEDVSLQPRAKYPRHLNVSQRKISPIANKSLANTNDFMSSPARKILEKLDRLTTPITGSDRISSLALKERLSKTGSHATLYNPYNRPAPPIQGKKPVPIKAVTVSASSNELTKTSSCGPIRSKKSQRNKTFGYSDVDLDSEFDITKSHLSTLNESAQVNFSNLPLLKMSQSTNTVESSFSRLERSSSPTLEFTFRQPKNVDDDDYKSIEKPDLQVEFKSKISEDERKSYDRRYVEGNSKIQKLWRCDTCFVENSTASMECVNCENLSKLTKENVVVSEKVAPDTFNKCTLVKKVLENETNVEKNITDAEPIAANNASGFAFAKVPETSSITTFSTFSFTTKFTTSNSDTTLSFANSESNQSLFPTLSPSNKTTLFGATTTSSTGFTFGNNAPVSSQSAVTSVPQTNLFNTSLPSSETKSIAFSKPLTSEPISTPKEFNATSFSFATTKTSVSDSEKTDNIASKPSFVFGSCNAVPVSSSNMFGNIASSGTVSFGLTSNDISKSSTGNTTVSSSFAVPSSNAQVSSKSTPVASFGSTVTTTPFALPNTATVTPIDNSKSIFGAAANSSPFAFGSSKTESSSTTSVAVVPATPFGSPATASPFTFGASKTATVSSSITPVSTVPATPFGSTATASPFAFGTSVTSSVSAVTTTENSKNLFGSVVNASPFSFGAANNNSVSIAAPVDNSKNMFGSATNASSFSFGMSKIAAVSSNTTQVSAMSSATNVSPFGSSVTVSPFAFGAANNTQASAIGFSAVSSNPISVSTFGTQSSTFGSSTSSTMNFGSVAPPSNAAFTFGQPNATNVTPFGQSSSTFGSSAPAASAITNNFSFNSNSNVPAVPFGQSSASHTFGAGTGSNLFGDNSKAPNAGFQFNANAESSANIFEFKSSDSGVMPSNNTFNNNIQGRKILRNRRRK